MNHFFSRQTFCVRRLWSWLGIAIFGALGTGCATVSKDYASEVAADATAFVAASEQSTKALSAAITEFRLLELSASPDACPLTGLSQLLTGPVASFEKFLDHTRALDSDADCRQLRADVVSERSSAQTDSPLRCLSEKSTSCVVNIGRQLGNRSATLTLTASSRATMGTAQVAELRAAYQQLIAVRSLPMIARPIEYLEASTLIAVEYAGLLSTLAAPNDAQLAPQVKRLVEGWGKAANALQELDRQDAAKALTADLQSFKVKSAPIVTFVDQLAKLARDNADAGKIKQLVIERHSQMTTTVAELLRFGAIHESFSQSFAKAQTDEQIGRLAREHAKQTDQSKRLELLKQWMESQQKAKQLGGERTLQVEVKAKELAGSYADLYRLMTNPNEADRAKQQEAAFDNLKALFRSLAAVIKL